MDDATGILLRRRRGEIIHRVALRIAFLSLVVTGITGLATLSAWAGGSGLNTIVVVNQASSNSCDVGNYYCEQRKVPPDNVLRIYWSGSNIAWTADDFQNVLAGPLLSMLAARQLTNQIEYVVLSMDIPYQTVNGTMINGTTSALFYGLKVDSGPEWQGITNSYANSEQDFFQARPASAPGFSFLTTLITGNTPAQAKRLIDRGLASDSTFPLQPVFLAKSSDPIRNIRFHNYDNTIFNTRISRCSYVSRTNCDSFWGQTNLLGMQTGLQHVSLTPNTFIPGAMADSLTSFGGIILAYNDQTSVMDFVNAGAVGSYGTVTEPSAILDKFPAPENYFYQARGFNLAECYYQSLVEPYEGIILGEPLSAPWQKPGTGYAATSGDTNAILKDLAPILFQFAAADSTRPLQQVDLFVDGKYFRPLTNVAPNAGNTIALSLNGYAISYVVPPNATLASVAAGLTAVINDPGNSNATQVAAIPHGDRIELRSTSLAGQTCPYYFTDNLTTNSGFRIYRTAALPGPSAPSLNVVGRDANGLFRMNSDIPWNKPILVQASTNLVDWTVLYTNPPETILDFIDTDAARFSSRFYRLLSQSSDNRILLKALPWSPSGAFRLHAETAGTVPYTIEASGNMKDWSAIRTNSSGGTMDFEDAGSLAASQRYYRTTIAALSNTNAEVLTLGHTTNGATLVRIDGAYQPYVLLVSTDLVHWSAIFTNTAPGQVQLQVSGTAGAASVQTTFLNASRLTFLASPAQAMRTFQFNGTPETGSYVQATITKTNGTKVVVAVTNLAFSGTVMSLATQLVSAINLNPALQGYDGIVAEDLTTGWFGAATFNLRARAAGLGGGNIQARLDGDSNIFPAPIGDQFLNQNLADLQPRNHLYVTAGAQNLNILYKLNTGDLDDGFHELAAIAMEGSSVRTQTRASLNVHIQNAPLQATLTLLDLSATNSLQGLYHITVAANTNAVATFRLFSTGGILGITTNRVSATFTLDPQTLGTGLHPFYATVETSGGHRFRTATQKVRFVGGN